MCLADAIADCIIKDLHAASIQDPSIKLGYVEKVSFITSQLFTKRIASVHSFGHKTDTIQRAVYKFGGS